MDLLNLNKILTSPNNNNINTNIFGLDSNIPNDLTINQIIVFLKKLTT